MAQGITTNPQVCHGKPVIAGTRGLASTLVDVLEGSDPREDAMPEYGVTDKPLCDAVDFVSWNR